MAKRSVAFKQIAEKLNAPGSQQLDKILKAMITPEEADLMLEVWNPVTCEDLAKKLDMDVTTLYWKLNAMVKKGVITLRKNEYAAQSRLIPLCHGTVNMSALTDKLWTDFFFGEWRPIMVEERYQRRLPGQWSVHRILPALQALAVSPHIRPEQVLWYENLDAVIQKADQISFYPCVCRIQYHQCDNKAELCMALKFPGEPPALGGPMTNAKKYTYKEALAELLAAEDSGMCHLSPNFAGLMSVCNCCGCCCRLINPMVYGGADYDMNDPTRSRYQASVNQDLCNGCQTCVSRCMFKAIEIQKTPGSKKLKASIDAKHCMGCGLCVYTCPQKAIRFDLVRPPNHIPNITFAQAMAWIPATPEEIKKAYEP